MDASASTSFGASPSCFPPPSFASASFAAFARFRALPASRFACLSFSRISLHVRIHAMLRSRLNSCTGLRNASSAASKRCVVFSVCSRRPSGTVIEVAGSMVPEGSGAVALGVLVDATGALGLSTSIVARVLRDKPRRGLGTGLRRRARVRKEALQNDNTVSNLVLDVGRRQCTQPITRSLR